MCLKKKALLMLSCHHPIYLVVAVFVMGNMYNNAAAAQWLFPQCRHAAFA
jgi:hypothetical protein